MTKYGVSLKVRFDVEGETMAEAVKNVIATLTDNFENVHSLELTNIFEFLEKDSNPVVCESNDVTALKPQR